MSLVAGKMWILSCFSYPGIPWESCLHQTLLPVQNHMQNELDSVLARVILPSQLLLPGQPSLVPYNLYHPHQEQVLVP